MADDIVHGMADLMAGFSAFPATLQRKALTKVMRRGGRPVLLAARVKIRSRSGKLARSGRVTVVRREDQVIARIVFGRRVKKDDPFYAWMVEGGTKPHEIRPKGAKSLFLAGIFAEVIHHPGAQKHAFAAPALEEAAAAAVSEMQDELAAQIEALGGLR
jgi:hypothetical protein